MERADTRRHKGRHAENKADFVALLYKENGMNIRSADSAVSGVL